jgi:hypothetical protein
VPRGKAATAVGIGIGLVGFALQFLGVPAYLAWLALAAGGGLLIVGSLWWYQEKHHRRIEAQTTPNIDAVLREGEAILDQIGNPSVPQVVWQASAQRWVSRGEDVIEEPYLWWFSYFEGLPQPTNPTASPTHYRNAQRQVQANRLERLRDIAQRQRVGREEAIGLAEARLVAVKNLLMGAWQEAQRLLNDSADSEEVVNYGERLRMFASAALIDSRVRELFSNEGFPPTTYPAQHMSSADFEFLDKRQKRLAQLQTHLAQSDIRAEFDVDAWNDYW